MYYTIFNPAQFSLVGSTVNINAGLLDTLVSGQGTKSYAFGGGAHDFTLDTAYAATASFPDDDLTLGQSGELGDGISEPHFHVVGKTPLTTNGVARLAGGSLRLTWGTATSGADGYPVSNQGTALAIPLLGMGDVSVTVTIKTNIFGVAASTVTAGLWVPASSSGTAPSNRTRVLLDINAAHTRETAIIHANTYAASGSMAAWESGGVFTRTYKFVASGLGGAVYGSAAGSSDPATLIHGRKNANSFSGNKIFVLALGNGSNGNGLYADLSAMSVTYRPRSQ